MKLRVLGCSGGSVRGRFLSSFLLDDRVALDAGGLTGPLTLEEQLLVDHVIVTHTHLDHNCGLPFLIDNVFGQHDDPVKVYGIRPVIRSLAKHMFNDELWPDFTKLPTKKAPILQFQAIQAEKPFTASGLKFTPIKVDHLTPTVGFLVEDAKAAILYTSDTGPTDRIWEVASAHKRLKAVITEVSFANEASDLARSSGHMTAEILAQELEKLDRDVPVLVTHTKPGHLPQIRKEIRALKRGNLELIRQGKTYTF